MLKEFVVKEKLKDYLLSIVKRDNNINVEIVEPASNIIGGLLDTYVEISKENGSGEAINYLFTVMANYVMLSMQLIDTNKQLIEKYVKEGN